MTQVDLIASGKRQQAIVSLHTLIRNNQVEVNGDRYRFTGKGMRTWDAAVTGSEGTTAAVGPARRRKSRGGMRANVKPWTAAICEVLSDGAWKSRELALSVAAPLVPAERAAEAWRAERERMSQRAGRGAAPQIPDDVAAARGQRSLARASLHTLIRTGGVEAGPGDRVRALPELIADWRAGRHPNG
jgi:hypothetical protein